MKAVILAAGEGRRLEPLTNVRPKPMLPVANRPLLEHVIDAVASAGIDEIVLVVGYKRERIQSHVEDGAAWDVDIEYVVQDKQLGTGHAVLQTEPVIEDRFLVLNGDRIIDPEIIADVADAGSAGETAMAVTSVPEPELFGVVEVEAGIVTAIHEKPPVEAVPSDLINAGVYAFDQAIFDRLRSTNTYGELALTAAIQRHLADSPVRAVPYDGPWDDVTRPWDLVDVTGRLLDRRTDPPEADVDRGESITVDPATVLDPTVTLEPGAAILRGCALGGNVRVGANATLRNVVLLPDVTVEPGAVLTNCVVGANAALGANATIPGGHGDVVIGDELYRDVDFGGMIGDNATIGACTSLDPGTVVGNGGTVEAGSRLSGRIAPDTLVRRG